MKLNNDLLVAEFIFRRKRVSLKMIKEFWENNQDYMGKPIGRVAFYKMMRRIEEMTGKKIVCCDNMYMFRDSDFSMSNYDVRNLILNNLAVVGLLKDIKGLNDRIYCAGSDHETKLLGSIVAGMAGKKCLRTTIHNPDGLRYDVKILEPWGLMYTLNRYYLIYKETTRYGLCSIDLVNISAMEIIEKGFVMDEEFSVREWMNYSFGPYHVREKDAERIVIHAIGESRMTLRQRPLHKSQMEFREGLFVLTMVPDGLLERVLFSRGHEVEVLQPMSLRKRMASMAMSVLDKHKEIGSKMGLLGFIHYFCC